MAFSKSYVGDTVATGVLMKTLNKIDAIVQGVTVKSELGGSIMANAAEFYYNLAPLVDDSNTVGDDFDSTNVGNKKATILLERALQIDEKIPQVSIDTASDGGVVAALAKAAIALENARGKKFITDLSALAQAKTYTKDAKAVDAVAEAIATFNGGTSVKIDGASDTSYKNAENGISPNAIIISDAFLYEMRKDDAFRNLFTGQGEYPAFMGKIFGLDIVYSKHLTAGFILVYGEGVAYPYSINTLRVVESENFNGVRLQAEVGIPNADEKSILPIDSHAMLFTEALS